jgi:hypothetical protein
MRAERERSAGPPVPEGREARELELPVDGVVPRAVMPEVL